MSRAVREFDDFDWTPGADLAERAQDETPWGHYLHTAVEFDADGRGGTVWPVDGDAGGGDEPPLGALHVITAVQPDGEPDSADSRARLEVLDRQLRASGIRSVRAVGVSFDGAHHEESRAVFGLDNDQARALGLRFGQVAVFGWRGPRWSLLACATDRKTHRGWRWEPR